MVKMLLRRTNVILKNSPLIFLGDLILIPVCTLLSTLNFKIHSSCPQVVYHSNTDLTKLLTIAVDKSGYHTFLFHDEISYYHRLSLQKFLLFNGHFIQMVAGILA